MALTPGLRKLKEIHSPKWRVDFKIYSPNEKSTRQKIDIYMFLKMIKRENIRSRKQIVLNYQQTNINQIIFNTVTWNFNSRTKTKLEGHYPYIFSRAYSSPVSLSLLQSYNDTILRLHQSCYHYHIVGVFVWSYIGWASYAFLSRHRSLSEISIDWKVGFDWTV